MSDFDASFFRFLDIFIMLICDFFFHLRLLFLIAIKIPL